MSDNCRIRFMDNNMAELASGQVEYSSALDSFPATNAYKNKFRSKLWMTSGYFKIFDATDGSLQNNKLYIKSGSTSYVVEINAGVYNTPEELASEISFHVGFAVGGISCTYTRGTKHMFSFTGLATIYLELDKQANSLWDTIGFTGNVLTVLGTTVFANETRIHTQEFIQFDFAYNAKIDFIGIIGALDQEFPIPATATIKLKANNLNDRWDTAPLEIDLTATSFGIFRFLDDLDDTSYRYWRLEFSDRSNTNGPEFGIGYIYLGDYFTFEDRNIINGFNKELVDDSSVMSSESGAEYFDSRVKYHQYSSMGMQYLGKDNRAALEELFRRKGTTTPFFVSLDPKLKISKELWQETKYVRFSKAPTFDHVVRDLFNVSYDLKEVL